MALKMLANPPQHTSNLILPNDRNLKVLCQSIPTLRYAVTLFSYKVEIRLK